MVLGFMRRYLWFFKWFLVIVVASFIWFYIPALTGSGIDRGTPGEVLAKVGGLPITVGEYQKTYQRQREFYARLYQGRLDPVALRRLGLEEQSFDSLVLDRVTRLEAKRLGLSVPDEALAKTIASSPEFQENGRFLGGEEIRRTLDQKGVSVEEFEESLRSSLLREKLEALVTDGVGVTDKELEREFRRRNEQIKAEYVLVDAARFRPQVAVDAEQVKARFEAKRESYRFPERRVVSYILLDGEALRPQVTVTERDLGLYYQDHRDEFKQEEETCAHHILIKVQSAPGAKEGHSDAEARKIAEGVRERLTAGETFEALAKKTSEDPGSAPTGGDLGCFGRGRMVPAFEAAAFQLEVGQTSDLVKTPFGYHIIRVTSRKEETVLPLAQVKERVRQILTSQRVEALASQKAEAIAGTLARGKSLEVAAREQALTVQKSAPFAQGETPDPLASPSLSARVFEMKVGDIEKEGFALPRGAAFIALAEVQPSRLPELKEVEAKVKADLVEEKALDKARLLAAEIKAKAAGAGLEKAAVAAGLVRKETPSLTGRGMPLGDLGSGAALDDVAFALPEKTLSDPVRVGAGYAVVRVLEKKAFDPAAFKEQRASLEESLRQDKRNQLFQDYMGQARQRFPLERRGEAFKRVVLGQGG
jgi:peptidyl-prolyl cis-trans isomerase D